MTILEALKASIGYPITDEAANVKLLKRGLNGASEANESVINSETFELATADCIMWIISAPAIREGGYSISMTYKEMLKTQADEIYVKYGEKSAGPTLTDGSSRW